MRSFVCHVCLTPVRSVYDQIEVRTEYRRISDYGRHAVVKTAELCRGCADAAIEAARRRPAGEQGTLL